MMKRAYIGGDTAVLFTDNEAWQCIGDKEWKPLDTADAHFKAKLLSDAEYRKMFGNLPSLPATAFERH